MRAHDERTPMARQAPRLRLVLTEEDAVRERLAAAIDAGDDEIARGLERRLRRMRRAR